MYQVVVGSLVHQTYSCNSKLSSYTGYCVHLLLLPKYFTWCFDVFFYELMLVWSLFCVYSFAGICVATVMLWSLSESTWQWTVTCAWTDVCLCDRHVAGHNGWDGCSGHHRVVQGEAAGAAECLGGSRDDPPCWQHHQVCATAARVKQTRPLVARHVSHVLWWLYSCYTAVLAQGAWCCWSVAVLPFLNWPFFILYMIMLKQLLWEWLNEDGCSCRSICVYCCVYGSILSEWCDILVLLAVW